MLDEAIKSVMGVAAGCPTPVEPIPNRSGIYFLLWKGKVVYVGQSVHVDWRVTTHYGERTKQFDSAFFLPFRESELNHFEDAFIRAIKPKYNAARQKAPTISQPTRDSDSVDAAVRFLTHTDEDGITFNDLLVRLQNNGFQSSRQATARLLDADHRLKWCPEDMKYRLRNLTPCTSDTTPAN